MLIPVAAFVAMTVSACIGGSPTDPAGADFSPSAVATLDLYPREPVLLPGQAVRFSARLEDASGAGTSGEVVWEAEDGTIEADGKYVAGDKPGRRKIKASHPKGKDRGQVADSTWVEVADPASQPTASRLNISPKAVSVGAGDTIQFEYALFADDGTRVASVVTWSATGGSVDNLGRYVAGDVGGEFAVVVTSGELEDASTVSVDADPPTEDPPASDPPPAPPANEEPVAAFASDCTDLGCSFDAGASSDADGSIVGYEWAYGDGATGSGRTKSHTYASAGTYQVSVTVRDDDGATAETSRNVTVEEPASGPPPPPPAGVQISPGQDIQSVVNTHPAGTAFVLKAGTHVRQQIQPRNGDIFQGEPGTVLDGQGAKPWAIRSGADDVTLRGFVVQNYASPVQFAAVEAEWGAAERWLVEDMEIRNNSTGGLKVGHDMVVRRVYAHHNGQYGLSGFGHRLLVVDSEISYNNTGGFDPLDDAGGLKFLHSDGIVFRNNHVHHNYGTGVWFDYNNINSVIENNLIEDNQVGGIHYEISYAGVIRGNTIRRNGDGSEGRFSRSGILVFASSDVEIYGNTLSGNDEGITGLDDNRGSGAHGEFRVKNLWVHDNDVTMNRGGSGLNSWAGDSAVYGGSANNRFDRNTYRITGNPDPFWYQGEKNETSWQNTGQDPNGTFIR